MKLPPLLRLPLNLLKKQLPDTACTAEQNWPQTRLTVASAGKNRLYNSLKLYMGTRTISVGLALSQQPLCPRCGTALKPAHGEWWCEMCKVYPYLSGHRGGIDGFFDELGQEIDKGIRSLTPSSSAPKCSICGNVLQWIEQYQRWYCRKCQKYA